MLDVMPVVETDSVLTALLSCSAAFKGKYDKTGLSVLIEPMNSAIMRLSAPLAFRGNT